MAREPCSTGPLLDLPDRWFEGLREYVADPDEQGLRVAYSLGREALAAELGPTELAELHFAALVRLIDELPREERAVVDSSGAFFREAASVLEITHRGYQDAQDVARVEQEHADQLRRLADASLTISSSLAVDEIASLAVDAACSIVGVPRANVSLTLAAPGEPSVAPAAATDAQSTVLPLGRLSITLTRLGRPIGYLVATPASHEAFTPRDEMLLRQLAHLAAVAITNADLYGREARIARALQRSLLPEGLPSLSELQATALFRAAGEGIEVGGDFYDLFRVDDGAIVALIGDVCGKGPEAASLTALARHTLRAVSSYERSPSGALQLLHRMLCDQEADDRFLTAAVARLEARPDGTLAMRLASGGHPLPLVVRADGSVTPVGTPGTLLGTHLEPELDNTETELRPGDVCVLYTDGVTDTRERDGGDGIIELTALLEDTAGLTIEATAARIEESLIAGSRRPRDDVAILILSPAGDAE
jgi:serine phosphatase RsbU (regulator of sigma subunit)